MKAWFPLYVGDFLGDTMHLSAAEVGAYMLLLCHAWRNNGEIPTNRRRLQEITRLPNRTFNVQVGELLKFFYMNTSKTAYRQKRLDAELLVAEDISLKRQAASAKGHAARWGYEAMPNAMPSDVPSGNENDAKWFAQSQSQSQKIKKKSARAPKEKDRATQFPNDFEITDQHRAKADALKLDVQREFEMFRTDAIAKGKRFENWGMALHTWLQRADQFNGGHRDKPIDFDKLTREIEARDAENERIKNHVPR